MSVLSTSTAVTSVGAAVAFCTSSSTGSLTFSGQGLTAFPNVFSCMNIIRLDVSRNYISYVPNEIGTLVKVTTLQLNSNRIFQLPSTIINMLALKNLWLQHNFLTTLPYLPPNIWQVLLSYNSISTIPVELLNTTTLSFLSLKGNGITVLSTNMFSLYVDKKMI